MSPSSPRPAFRPLQRGAALLTAMVIVTLVATLSAAMMWRQWRAVQIEAAERSRVQSSWILAGALDWARLILREDKRNGGPDHLGEPWAVPLAEARLSTFLAMDRENTQDAPDAFLSGSIQDMQARFNLNNLALERNADDRERQLAVLRQLIEQLGLEGGLAERLALALRRATPTPVANEGSENVELNDEADKDAPLLPTRVEDLAWLGIDAEAQKALAPHVTLLPKSTPVNLNTASREVIAAATGMDVASAERLIQHRQRKPITNLAEAAAVLGSKELNPKVVGTQTAFFEVRGRMRIGERAVEERSLVQRGNNDVIALRREHVSLSEGGVLPRP